MKTHGNTNWMAKDLVMLAVLWVWSANTSLTAAFGEARIRSNRLFGRIAVGSYQALTTALVTYGKQMVPLLWKRLHRLMEQVGDEHWRSGRWLPLAVDGSRVSTPRTKKNEKAFCAANYGQGKRPSIARKSATSREKETRRRRNRHASGLRHLSDAQAAKLYTLRWGIELQFRTLKQTFGRRTLRSRTPDRAYAELAWSSLGLWMIHLFAVKEQIRIGEPPDQASAAMAIRVVRSILFLWCDVPDEGAELKTLLQNAVIDQYDRSSEKHGRYRPHNKDAPSAGKPKIAKATALHRQKLNGYTHRLQTAA